jgi:hypothetical protein
MYQRLIFSGISQFIGEKLLLRGFFDTVNLKSGKSWLYLCYVNKASCCKTLQRRQIKRNSFSAMAIVQNRT